MPFNLRGRSLVTDFDFNAGELQHLLDIAISFKQQKKVGIFPRVLQNKNVAFIFLKPSCRTRTSSVVATSDLGASAEIFSAEEIRFGIKESVKDIARVFGRMFDGIGVRGFEHETIQSINTYAGVPVWNLLCDKYHPTQVLADLMTIAEVFGSLSGIKIAYVGDGRNNMARSLVIGAVKMGMDVRIVSPDALSPDPDMIRNALEHGTGKVSVSRDPAEGLNGCQVIYGDIWVSMGEEAIAKERISALQGYKVTSQMMALTGRSDTIYLHCMPALHDDKTEFAKSYPLALDVDDSVFESPQSLVFEQAENRMHTIKALMALTI